MLLDQQGQKEAEGLPMLPLPTPLDPVTTPGLQLAGPPMGPTARAG